MAGPVEQEAGPERRRYVITEAGIADVERWLAEPAPPEPDLQSELFAKVVLALMLDRPANGYLDAQRAAHLQRMRELTDDWRLTCDGCHGTDGTSAPDQLVPPKRR